MESPEATATAAAASAPLELVSLRHERQGDRLIVSGLVRNGLAGPSDHGPVGGGLHVRSPGHLCDQWARAAGCHAAGSRRRVAVFNRFSASNRRGPLPRQLPHRRQRRASPRPTRTAGGGRAAVASRCPDDRAGASEVRAGRAGVRGHGCAVGAGARAQSAGESFRFRTGVELVNVRSVSAISAAAIVGPAAGGLRRVRGRREQPDHALQRRARAGEPGAWSSTPAAAWPARNGTARAARSTGSSSSCWTRRTRCSCIGFSSQPVAARRTGRPIAAV